MLPRKVAGADDPDIDKGNRSSHSRIESTQHSAPGAVCVHAFVDANHAGNVVTRRSHSGIIICVNNSPVIWCSE